MAIWIRIEDLSEAALQIEPTKFNAVDGEGRAYGGLDPKDALQRIFDETAVARAALGNIIAGPITGPTIKKAKEGESSAEFYKTSLQPGSIPPHTFREGAIFFETSKKQPKTLKVSLGNLWPETFLFEFKK